MKTRLICMGLAYQLFTKDKKEVIDKEKLED